MIAIGGLHFAPEDIATFISTIGVVVGLYGRFKGEIIAQEQRLTKLDKDMQYLKDFKTSTSKRLDDHDKQNQTLFVMAEQIKNLSDDIRELKAEIKKSQKG